MSLNHAGLNNPHLLQAKLTKDLRQTDSKKLRLKAKVVKSVLISFAIFNYIENHFHWFKPLGAVQLWIGR